MKLKYKFAVRDFAILYFRNLILKGWNAKKNCDKKENGTLSGRDKMGYSDIWWDIVIFISIVIFVHMHLNF